MLFLVNDVAFIHTMTDRCTGNVTAQLRVQGKPAAAAVAIGDPCPVLACTPKGRGLTLSPRTPWRRF